MPKQQPQKITKPLLRQINDKSGGGFLLFTFDEEGLPQMHSNYDSNAEALALQYYVQNWIKAIEIITIDQMTVNITKPEDPTDSEDSNGLDEI